MKSLNAEFSRSCAFASRSPRAYVIIENENRDIYLTSDSDIGLTVSAPDVIYNDVIGGLVTEPESVTPEDGVSVLGGGSITLLEEEFTEELRDLFSNLQDTIYNNKVKIFVGDAAIDLADYEQVQTLYVKTISNTDVDYTINLQTSGFLQSQTIFTKAQTRVFTAFTSADKPTSITVNSTDGFELVAHDSTWAFAPNQEIGLIELKGKDAKGDEVIEWMSYTGKTLTTFTGITRAVLGTGLVTALGSTDGDNATEVTEVALLDLPIGKLLIALLTGELYGQIGKTLPAGWHCGISSSDIDLASFENIGNDLWIPATNGGFRLWLDNPEAGNAKQLISQQLLRLGLVLYTNQFGQIACKRYTQVIDKTPAQVYLTNDDIKNKPTFTRNANDIKNSFGLQWGYRGTTKEYTRSEILIDGESQQRNNYISKPEVLSFKWVRNYRQEAYKQLLSLLDGLRSRKASAPITPTITCDLVNTYNLEVMDVIGLYMETFPDFTDVGDVNRSFEIQRIQHDWMNGTVTMQLYGASDILYPLTKDGSIPVIDDSGRTLITEDLTGSFTDIAGLLTLTGTNSLLTNGVDGGLKEYYYPGYIDLNGQTLNTRGDALVHCEYFDATDSQINGVGQGSSGGAGGIPTDGAGANSAGSIPPEAGTIGFVGGNDLPMDGVYHYFPIGKPRTDTRIVNGIRAPYLNKSAPNLNIYVDADNILQGVPDYLRGAGGSGGLWFKSYNQGLGTTTKLNGAAGGSGGAGFMIIANAFIYNINTVINLSGSQGGYSGFNWSGDDEYYAGSGSGGTGGALYIYIKDKNQPLPNNADGMFVSRNGVTPWKAADLSAPESSYLDKYMSASGAVNWVSTGQWNRWPYVDQAMSNAVSGQDFSNSKFVTGYLVSETPAKIISGVDAEQLIPAPTLLLTEKFNTPSTPLGDFSTIAVSVSGITDPNYSYTRFFLEKIGQASVEMSYATENSNSAAVKADGSTYNVFAIPVSKTGLAGEIAKETITVKNYLTQPAIEDNYKLADLSGLKLKNSIAANNFTQFKSGNAEFVWHDSSRNNAIEFIKEGLLGAGAGAKDPYFKDYQVVIASSAGEELRRESVTAPSYTYTLDKNKRDNAGRNFTVFVTPRGQNNQTSRGQFLAVENPAPSAPLVTDILYSRESVTIKFEPETEDVDYIGVSYLGKIYTGREITIPVPDLRTFPISLTSYDQFGFGDSYNFNILNPMPDVVENLSYTATYNSITLNFVEPTNDYDYKGIYVSYRKIGEAFGALVFYGLTSSCTIGDLQPDTDYEFSVLTADTIGPQDVSTTIEARTSSKVGTIYDQSVTVGLSGDYATLPEAIEALSSSVPAYVFGGIQAQILIKTGTTLTFADRLYISGIDLSWVTLSSEDAFVPISTTGWSGESFIKVDSGGGSPIINTEFRAGSGINATGLEIRGASSSAEVNSGKGFTYFINNVTINDSATFTATGGKFTNASGTSMSIAASNAQVGGADVSDSLAGISIVEGSSVFARSMVINNTVGYAIGVSGSYAVFTSSEITGIDKDETDPAININGNSRVEMREITYGFTGFPISRDLINIKESDVILSDQDFSVLGNRSISAEFSRVSLINASNFDLTITNGCTIAANGATGATYSETVNTQTVNGYIYNN